MWQCLSNKTIKLKKTQPLQFKELKLDMYMLYMWMDQMVMRMHLHILASVCSSYRIITRCDFCLRYIYSNIHCIYVLCDNQNVQQCSKQKI